MRRDHYKDSDITKERYEQATDEQQYVFEVCWEMWDPRTVIPMEVGDWYTSELQEDKDIHTVLDCSCAIDHLVDPFTDTPFGLNHRVHSATDATLRFDIRAENGNNSKSELSTLLDARGFGKIGPKYATRMKKSEAGVEWFRIVHLEPLAGAIDAGLQPPTDSVEKWVGDDYTAWLFDYELLEGMGCVVAEFNPDGEKVFAQEQHESLNERGAYG